MAHKFYEDQRRSIVKAVSFRCILLCSDAIIIYAITHRYDTTLVVMIASNTFSTLIYYFHERIWNTVHWGKKHKK